MRDDVDGRLADCGFLMWSTQHELIGGSKQRVECRIRCSSCNDRRAHLRGLFLDVRQHTRHLNRIGRAHELRALTGCKLPTHDAGHPQVFQPGIPALALAAVIALLVVPAWNRMPYGRFVVPVAVLAIAITYPYYNTHLPQVPIFGPFPQISTMVVMMIFTMMALGLNFVVGYAGLLDLGYVAFYAMGAYMAGWFASNQFARQKLDLGAVGLYPGWSGYHITIWLVLLMAGIATRCSFKRNSRRLTVRITGAPTIRRRISGHKWRSLLNRP